MDLESLKAEIDSLKTAVHATLERIHRYLDEREGKAAKAVLRPVGDGFHCPQCDTLLVGTLVCPCCGAQFG